VLQFT